MKKINSLLALIALASLGSCSSKVDISQENINLEYSYNSDTPISNKKGALGDFNLLAPCDGTLVEEMPTFSWEESENAVSYTLEVCSLASFDHASNSVIYSKETNISSTSFKLSTALKTKNLTYYWRVTAVNPFNTNTVGKEKVSSVENFYYKAQTTEEIPISVGEEGDWKLHDAGSYATIAIDDSDFFGTGNSDNLIITFEKEDTKQGIDSSDGWIVVTKVLEMDLYGTDSLYFNFYYSGNDADVLVRLIDADGEYWYNKIQVSQNAKQSVLMKFSEFTLRTKDTTVQNSIFNYEHIQYLEVVFEHSFGDGCCVIGNFRAVNFANYTNLFMDKLNFNKVPQENWIVESYNFKRTISQDGSELQLEYSTTAGFNNNAKGIGSYGYGFAKIPLNCYFATGNAIRMKIKYSGYKTNVKAIVRIYEEDTDRWSYEQPFNALKENEYSEITIPYTAFAKSEIRGDGNRQFYYILQIQLGLSNCYGSGSIYYKDVEIVTLPSVSSNRIEVGSDGLIENFDSYSYRTQLYEHWENSITNKDEGIFLNTNDKYNNGSNVQCGQFNYKSDMGLATYDCYTTVTMENAKAIKFWIKDASVLKSGESQLSYLKSEDVASTFIVQLALKDGRWYRYTIEKAPKRWTEYVINFDDFELNQGIELETSDPFVSQNVVNFAFGMQYFYYDANGKAYPVYTESNPIYMDEIRFVDANATKITQLEKELHPETGTNITKIDDMEYASQSELETRWIGLNGHDYEKVTLSNDVSSQGGSHSLQLDYKGYNSPSYAIFPAFGSDVKAKAIQFDLKGDGVATVYINFYIRSGSSFIQYRRTLTNVEASWNRYLIGFDSTLFSPVDNAQAGAMNLNSMPLVQRITFGIVNNNGTSISSIYLDNMLVTGDVKSFTVNTKTAL